jgi:RimJ/RimL family protein N-acetyltransferase
MKIYLKTLNNVVLKRITNSDLDLNFLYSIRISDNFLKFCSRKRDYLKFDEFKLELKNDFDYDRHIQFIIKKLNDQFIGTIYSYSYNSFDRYLFFSVFLLDDYQNYGYGVGSIFNFLRIAFRNYNLFKVYFDVYEYNYNVLNMISKCNDIFVQEGCFIQHREFDGNRYNMLRFAIYRESLGWLL